MSSLAASAPPDVSARNIALDSTRSILVQAPAGSGKTDLLTRRFLRLLGEVDDPAQVVAITFTNAAAAEMRRRIMTELEKAEANSSLEPPADEFSMEALAQRALKRSRTMGWQLLDLSSRLRISTIDSFCRELALQQPLTTGVGGALDISEHPAELYRRAARLTLERLGDPGDSALSAAVEALLLWRDNNWREMEDLLVNMLLQRDRWMQNFVLESEHDWDELRARLERPFAKAVARGLTRLSNVLRNIPDACDEALALARFAFSHGGGAFLKDLAEIAELPSGPFSDEAADLEAARQTYDSLAQFLLTKSGAFRSQAQQSNGFPPDHQVEKLQMRAFLRRLDAIPGLAAALRDLRGLPHCRYTEDEWQIVRACFTVLRHASGQLKTAFAESGTADFIEVAQIAQQVLRGEDGLPTDAALALADGIHHLLVDEFQDTSRRQHQLLSSLVAAWPDQFGRSVFVVGDPMQSIYFFRDAEVELFTRIRSTGLEAADGEPLCFTSADLTANFRTAPELVNELNGMFGRISATGDGSGIAFSRAEAARPPSADPGSRLRLHLDFVPQTAHGSSGNPQVTRAREEAAAQREAARARQTAEIVDLIQNHSERMNQARESGGKFRIAILGRARSVLAPIAQALRDAKVPFRAVDLETLGERPEILDALALARALLNGQDRVSWLGVLRAPWCGLSLAELHAIAGTDEWPFPPAPVPQLLAERMHLLGGESRKATERVLAAVNSLPRLRALLPTSTIGTLVRQVWVALGGDRCVDATGRANLDLLWTLLDKLPQGEQDLIGPALYTALEQLCAQPDPAASNDAGVQLMTIHKSKGLEFEVVIVPDLQVTTRRGSRRMLSWLERGLTAPSESGAVTEFLVAPMQPKGADRGRAKEWVDRVYSERESQETRRILYVAATRAREELHLFARPAYKHDRDDSLTLIEPSNSLFETAWPALEDGVRARFEEWKTTVSSQRNEAPVISALAAQAELIVMPRPPAPALLRRLPLDFQIASPVVSTVPARQVLVGGADKPYRRHEGGLLSRAIGNAVHKLLEELARLRTANDWNAAIIAVNALEPAIIAQVRASGISASESASVAAQAMRQARKAANDPVGQWLLSPHTDAASEAGWAGIVDGGLRQVRVDRVFRAGSEPMAEGDDTWWVIDFKTAHADDADPTSVLPVLRAAFAPQLETYAAVLRNLHGASTNFRAGLYYPRMALLDWWEV
jgi:ATP-dependent exoDNAse (exonuclease V) beta subunit